MDEVGEILGFIRHEVSVLMSAGLLKPLGKPSANGHKFFCAVDIAELAQDRNWLDKATRAVAKRWQERNRKRQPKQTIELVIS